MEQAQDICQDGLIINPPPIEATFTTACSSSCTCNFGAVAEWNSGNILYLESLLQFNVGLQVHFEYI